MEISHQGSNDMTMECIWLTDGSVCELMKSCRCHGENCGFRRTVLQNQKSLAEWQSRISSLSEEQQNKIARKYYGGNMPWK